MVSITKLRKAVFPVAGFGTGFLPATKAMPKELLTRLPVEKGDMLHVIETENGIELTPYDPEFDAQMAVAEDIMREDRDILRKLAK